jgi:hypothetical protein
MLNGNAACRRFAPATSADSSVPRPDGQGYWLAALQASAAELEAIEEAQHGLVKCLGLFQVDEVPAVFDNFPA